MSIDIEFDTELVLPAYRHLLTSDADVFCLWGGRDSGKTYAIAQLLIIECLEMDYFKCILVRKVQDTVKDSQWQTIKDVIEEWGLTQFFDFTTHPLEIRCKNGNKFIARGCDKVDKIKSIKDPNRVWIEEMDQIKESDHQVISTTLRTNKSNTREYWSFNPETPPEFEYSEFWLYKYVGEHYNKSRRFVRQVTVGGNVVDVTFESVHTTYLDNEYCPPVRVAKYMSVTKGDIYTYNVWIHGWWGNRAVTRPFAFAFDASTQVSDRAIHQSGMLTIVSIDFNVQPFCASLKHIWQDGDGWHNHTWAEISVDNGSIEEMANRIRSMVDVRMIEITGDAMGNNRRVKIKESDNASLFISLRHELKLHTSQIRVKSNPFHKQSRENFNFMLQNVDFCVHPSCTGTIRDLRTVEIDTDGKIIKTNRSKESELADFLDNERYAENVYFEKFRKLHGRK